MKRFRGWIILLIFIALCAGGVWLTLQVTADYPNLGEPVSYSVNQVDGFELTIEKPSYSPFKGYTIQWTVSADSKDVYFLTVNSTGFEYLERCIDGQWYRLEHSQDNSPFNSMVFALGGAENTRLEGSIVQKYNYYGTRLEIGAYRIVLEMKSEDGTPHYLAAEFNVRK